jgi:hypothetical protein
MPETKLQIVMMYKRVENIGYQAGSSMTQIQRRDGRPKILNYFLLEPVVCQDKSNVRFNLILVQRHPL